MKLAFLECLRKVLNLKSRSLIGSYNQLMTDMHQIETLFSLLSVIVSQKSGIILGKRLVFQLLNTLALQRHHQRVIRHVPKKEFRNLMLPMKMTSMI